MKKMATINILFVLLLVCNSVSIIGAEGKSKSPGETEYNDVSLWTWGPIAPITKIQFINGNSSQIQQLNDYFTKVHFAKPNSREGPVSFQIKDLDFKISYKRDIVLKRVQRGLINFLDGSSYMWPRLYYMTRIFHYEKEIECEKHDVIVKGFSGRIAFCNFHLPIIYHFQFDGHAENVTLVEYT